MGKASDQLAKLQERRKPTTGMGSPVEKGDAMQRVSASIRDLGLEQNIVELETHGLTVVPPEKCASPDFIARLKAATVRFIEQLDGHPIDFETGETHRNQILGDYHYPILREPVFQEMLCQPAALALLDYLLGESCIIHASSVLCKGPHDQNATGSELVVHLHSDNQLLTGPFNQPAEFANITWTLTEYNQENGSLAYVPGSHLLCRHPLPGEGMEQAVAIDAPPGSMICWHGNTWHGAFLRNVPGIRLSTATVFTKPYIWPRNPLREDVTQEILDANPPRFAKFCGRHIMTNWREEGPTSRKGMISNLPTRFH